MTLFVIFGIIPLIKQVESGGDAQDRLEYLYGEFRKQRYDPEVSAIVSAYESSFGTIFEQAQTQETPASESETEATTTSSETELTAHLAETTPAETTTQGEEE